MKGLIIRLPWIDFILDGVKSWEIRGSNTNVRGKIALLQSGTKSIVGVVELVDSRPLSLMEYRQSEAFHCIRTTDALAVPEDVRMGSCVLGNHDGPDYLEGTSILNVHGQIVEVEGLRFAGFGGAPRYNSKPYGQYTEDEVRAFVDDLGYVDVFLAHANPQWVSDVSQDDVAHAGFQAFASYINQAHPAHFFHGHLHERYDKQVRGTTVHAVYQAQVIVI